MQRVKRYPPIDARMVRLEEGPPMYRMLGYADVNNQHSDLCDHPPPGYHGPFSTPRLPPNQQVPFGPGRFGLPSMPLAYTTNYWDERTACKHNTTPVIHTAVTPHDRPEAIYFPEMAVPGTGVCSKFRNSGYQWVRGLPPPRSSDSYTDMWANLTPSQFPSPYE